jgi:transposase-like protein
MISDRGKSYDAEEFRAVSQQKCLGHILRNLADAVETKQGRARESGILTKALLQESMELRRAQHSPAADEFADKARELRQPVSYHLRKRMLPDEDTGAC